MNNKKEKGSVLREKIRRAAANLKDKSERAKNMSEENKVVQEQETETTEQVVDVEALQAELEKTKTDNGHIVTNFEALLR